VAIATALVVPASRIIQFQSEWDTFCDKWGISDFHSSECAAANPKSCFAGWDEAKIAKVFKRVRQIIRKYGVRAFSLSVHKSDYDAVVPAANRPMFGHYHYTYAIHNMLSVLDNWACRHEVEYPLEFVFDWMDKTQKIQKREIESSLERSEKARPGRFEAHYSFRKRGDTPGLQCVDLIAWTCYRESLYVHNGTPLTELQKACWKDFNDWDNGRWLTSVGQTRKQLQEAVLSLNAIDHSNPIQVRTRILG
jgi:hypothetical protein